MPRPLSAIKDRAARRIAGAAFLGWAAHVAWVAGDFLALAACGIAALLLAQDALRTIEQASRVASWLDEDGIDEDEVAPPRRFS